VAVQAAATCLRIGRTKPFLITTLT